MTHTAYTFLKLILLVMVVSQLGVSQAEEVSEVSNKAYIICKNRKDVRTVRVQLDHDGFCNTYYSKQGTEKSIGSGKNQESCVGFLNNVKTNLEKSSWTCRDISSTTITSLE
jgi:hypothetical protein